MSGLEVVGIVLAAFPLIIAGLEHWRDVETATGLWRRIKSECLVTLIDMEYHKLIFERRQISLLESIVGEAEDAADIVRDPRRNWHTDASLLAQLRQRLGESSFPVYMDTISRMYDTMTALKRELGLESATIREKISGTTSKPQVSKRAIVISNLEYQRFRLWFSTRESVRAKLFAQLIDCNNRLETLLGTEPDTVGLPGATRKRKKRQSLLESTIKVVRESSENLFEVFKKAWQCRCQEQHLANMRLQHRTERESIWFELVLAFSARIDKPDQTPWLFRRLQCRQAQFCTLPRIQLSIIPSHNLPTSSRDDSSLRTNKRRAHFTVQTPELPVIDLLRIDTTARNLCQELVEITPGTCLSINGNDGGITCMHLSSQNEGLRTPSTQSLGTVLSQINRTKRYSVALNIASSVAQLTQTPWLRTSLSKDDILFLPDHVGTAQIPVIGEPFIKQRFIQSSAGAAARPDETFFHSLGIILLELCFGKRIEDHPRRQDYPTANLDARTIQAIDTMVALEWLQDVCGETGEDYASAVRWCFTGITEPSKDWRSAMIKEVVIPLESCQIPDMFLLTHQ